MNRYLQKKVNITSIKSFKMNFSLNNEHSNVFIKTMIRSDLKKIN